MTPELKNRIAAIEQRFCDATPKHPPYNDRPCTCAECMPNLQYSGMRGYGHCREPYHVYIGRREMPCHCAECSYVVYPTRRCMHCYKCREEMQAYYRWRQKVRAEIDAIRRKLLTLEDM